MKPLSMPGTIDDTIGGPESRIFNATGRPAASRPALKRAMTAGR